MARHLVSIAVVGIVAWPTLHVRPRDDFPLSTYPMFTASRGRVASFDVVVGRDGNDRLVRLDPRLIADTDEVMVAAETVTGAIVEGRASRLCEDVAMRVRRPRIVRVEVRTEQYDTIAWLRGHRRPSHVRAWADCRVPR